MVQITSSRVQSTRQTILEHLRRDRRTTVKELEKISGLTSTGIRQHLMTLERDGLIKAKEERGRVGRPAFVYFLTEKADSLFPKSYDLLVTALLEELRESVDRQELYRILNNVALRMAAPHRAQVQGKSLPDRAKKAVRVLEDQGYLIEVREEGTDLFMDEFSCPFPKAAHKDRAVCALHVNFVSALTGSDARLSQSLMRGDPTCTYHLRPASTSQR